MLSTNQKGAIAESAIVHEAIKLGIDVYRPLVEGGRYDLILGVGDRLLRTQCKWARRKSDVVVISIRTSRFTPRGYVRTTYSAREIDGIAAWCDDLRECYFIPITDIDGQGYLHLRLAPARNNQELLVHWAADYRLGAIAQLGERVTGSHEVGGSNPPSSTSEGPFA
jgi:PD-(D/E)XK endonuclease